VVLALAVHLWRELRLDVEVWSEPGPDGAGREVLHVRPAGVLYFGSAPLLETRVLDELAARRDVTEVQLHLQRLGRVDITGALVLRAICRDLDRGGVRVELSGAQPHNRRLIEEVFRGDPVQYTRRSKAGGEAPGRDPGAPTR
jgi:SulP family sulfate permease